MAFADDSRTVTFVGFWGAIREWGDLLTQAGAGPRRRVAIVANNRIDTLAAVFGAMYIGAVAAPLSPLLTRPQLVGILSDAAPAVLVLPSERLADAVDLAPRVVTFDGDLVRCNAADDNELLCDPDVVLMMYTSGTQSQPRAVVCDSGAVEFVLAAIAKRLRYRSDDRVISALPLSFDYGLYQAFLSLVAGSMLSIVAEGFGPALLARSDIVDGTVIPVVPGIAQQLIAAAERRKRNRSSVRLLTNTGDHLAPSQQAGLRNLFPAAAIVSMYGLTECKRASISDPDADLTSPGTAGTALDGTELEIVDGKGRSLPAFQVGELVVKGPHVMRGYWRDPEATRQRFWLSDGGVRCLRTGDFGHLDASRHFYFRGRRDDTFKIRGIRVNGGEITSAACSVAGVESAVVLPPADGLPPALVVCGDVEQTAVVGGVIERVGAARTPAVCVVVNAFPITPNGKVDRVRLAELVRPARAGRCPASDPRAPG